MFLLGQNPLSKCNGIPVKEMIEHLNEAQKTNKGSEIEQLMNQCQSIYQPPGVF